MSGESERVFEDALALPPNERADLANRLLTSLDAVSQKRIDELWAREAEDRLDAHERGELKPVPVREVFDSFYPKKK
jgi:putative addiction module component (TIGR02574 family)